MEKVFAHEVEFPLAIFVVLGDGIELLLINHCLVKNPGEC